MRSSSRSGLRNAAAFYGGIAVGILGGVPQAPAQFALAADSANDAARRDQEFAELHRDVAEYDRELSIYKRVVRLVSPSVVHVEARPLPQYRFRRDVEEAGSGVIVRIGERDFVLTNRHVIKHSDEENVKLELVDGRQFRPKRIWTDRETDVAALEVEEPDLVPARIGDSDSMEIGDQVMAFGSPFNLRQSASRGIISAKGRSNLDLGEGEVEYQNFMQTDAAINPGNSGGPLVNLRGEIIGLNTAIASNSGGNDGIGFSIPVNIVMSVARQLAERGHVERGFLGVTLDSRFDAQAAQFIGLPRLAGARVTKVAGGSPAARADLRENDVILRFNGAAIENDDHLVSLVKLAEVGREVDLLVLRDGELLSRRTAIGRAGDFQKLVDGAATDQPR
ncbi:MAG: trypsin-like peptidase domain-containing protein [Pirellulales bacterium]|nr:trypsin-like peptidase domain-containing protein [Pirellulales bacterium]